MNGTRAVIRTRFVERKRKTLVRVHGCLSRPAVAPHDARLIVGIRPGHNCTCPDSEKHAHDRRQTPGRAGLFLWNGTVALHY